MNNTFEEAVLMAVKRHDGQTRWNGDPYVTHPIRVARRVRDLLGDAYTPSYVDMAKTIAVLHDVIEDTDTPGIIIETAFGSKVECAVQLLSRPPKKLRTLTYQEWIDKLIATGNHLVIAVKCADVQDNLSDLKSGNGLRKKYDPALVKLLKALDQK